MSEEKKMTQQSVTSSSSLAWKRLKKSVSETEPKDIVKLVVIASCVLLVYIQVMTSYHKLLDPAITSHTELKENTSMNYPALTICREPPFNRRYYAQFNITNSHLGSYPLISQWATFPFDKYSIADFFKKAVYPRNVVVAFSLGRDINKSELIPHIHLTLGQCFTLVPENYTLMVGKKYGFSVLLVHDLYDYRPLYDEVPGWFIYIHETREKFSENTELLAARQDQIFVKVGEDVEVNLDATEFRTIKNCNNSYNYSSTECEEECWIKDIMKYVNCSGPWFPMIDLPYCDNYDDLKQLYRYTMKMQYLNCCLPHCTTKQYKSRVISRVTSNPSSNLSSISVYFTSKSVLIMEETFAYDWNVFLADLGGSLGFLLGLSVLSIIGFLEQIVTLIFGRKPKKEERKTSFPYLPDYTWKFDTPLRGSLHSEKTLRY